MRVQIALPEMYNNISMRLMMQALEQMEYMTWQDQKRVVDLCMEITRPIREAKHARYAKEKKGDGDLL